MSVIQIGPFTLDGLIFLCVIAFAAAMFVAIRYDKKHEAQIENRLWWLTLLAALIGRLIFVLRFWPAYQESPAEIINIRDGGFDWPAALIVYGLALLWLFLRQRALFRGMAWALGTATVVISMGLLWLQPWQKNLPNWFEMAHLEQLSPLASEDWDHAFQYQGKPTVINLWATWCPPCRREMPVLEKAQNTYKNVNFVFINQGETAAEINKFLNEQGLNLQNLWLDEYALSGQAVASKGLPATLFLDSKGRIVSSRLGELSAASLRSHLESIGIQK
ncbi:MAG TPA: TlpA disulfide reductase family protein [Paenalcaligenes sp.]|nr:TlpA disulfide reductase family protein [Paenalcaligenes sp.]